MGILPQYFDCKNFCSRPQCFWLTDQRHRIDTIIVNHNNSQGDDDTTCDSQTHCLHMCPRNCARILTDIESLLQTNTEYGCADWMNNARESINNYCSMCVLDNNRRYAVSVTLIDKW